MIPIRGLRAPVAPSPRRDEAQQTPHHRRKFDWSPDREALLARLWSEGVVIREIAAQLGCSGADNMVSAKARRLGLPRRRNPVSQHREGKHG